jgi:hypothetical protein
MANPSPAITFRVNLDLHKNESVGPDPNPNASGILHPDRYVNLNQQDEAQASIAQRKDHRSTWLPGLLRAENIALKDSNEFTAYGQRAIYLRDTYADGWTPVGNQALPPEDRRWLTVVSIS